MEWLPGESDFPLENADRPKQMKGASCFSPYQINGHRLGQRRSAREQSRRRRHRGKTVGERSKRQICLGALGANLHRFTNRRRDVGCGGQGARLLVIDPFDEAGNLAQSSFQGRSQSFASGHDLEAGAARAHQQRLENAVPSY
jgi:hypothetical protein